jgi:hypothetical protein
MDTWGMGGNFLCVLAWFYLPKVSMLALRMRVSAVALPRAYNQETFLPTEANGML